MTGDLPLSHTPPTGHKGLSVVDTAIRRARKTARRLQLKQTARKSARPLARTSLTQRTKPRTTGLPLASSPDTDSSDGFHPDVLRTIIAKLELQVAKQRMHIKLVQRNLQTCSDENFCLRDRIYDLETTCTTYAPSPTSTRRQGPKHARRSTRLSHARRLNTARPPTPASRT